MQSVDSRAATIFDWNELNNVVEPTASGHGNPASGVVKGSSFAEIAASVADQTVANSTTATGSSSSPSSFKFWEKDKLSFGDFVDIINPLQHIPIVATLYRNLTGDQIGAAPRIIGGALWGRVGGFVTGVANAIVEWFTGRDIGDHIYTAFFGSTHDVKQAQAPRNSEQENFFTNKQVQTQNTAPSEKHSDSVSERVQANSVDKERSVPWPAASALHIFQRHHQQFGADESSLEPIVRYIA